MISSVIEVEAGVVILEFMAWHITNAKRWCLASLAMVSSFVVAVFSEATKKSQYQRDSKWNVKGGNYGWADNLKKLAWI